MYVLCTLLLLFSHILPICMSPQVLVTPCLYISGSLLAGKACGMSEAPARKRLLSHSGFSYKWQSLSFTWLMPWIDSYACYYLSLKPQNQFTKKRQLHGRELVGLCLTTLTPYLMHIISMQVNVQFYPAQTVGSSNTNSFNCLLVQQLPSMDILQNDPYVTVGCTRFNFFPWSETTRIDMHHGELCINKHFANWSSVNTH